MYYIERRITTSTEQYNVFINQSELGVNIYIIERQFISSVNNKD